MKHILLSILPFIALHSAVNANSMVIDSLNNADKLFKLGSDGCIMVKLAIKVSTTPEAFGEVSDNLKEKVKKYARRCKFKV